MAFLTMGLPSVSRRSMLQAAGFSIAALCGRHAAYALKPGKPSKEKLLNSLREEKTPEEIEAEKARLAEERRVRLEKQRELQAAAERRRAGLEEDESKSTEIGTNLRGQYYFPTARKRYLPRVKLAFDSLPDAENSLRAKKWSALGHLTEDVLSNAVLPMKLYASSLAGGGLNIGAKFIFDMTKEAETFELLLNKLTNAIKKKDASTAMASIKGMKNAILQYRTLGKLESDDFGIGDIPAQAIGSGFSNNNFSLYQKNKSMQTAKRAPSTRSLNESIELETSR